jgi:hypothetical protein
MENRLNNLKNEVTAFYRLVKDELSPIENYNEFYKGYKMFLSPVSYDPDIFFIGINPGNGESNIEDVEEREQFEYLQWDFTLAKETRATFAMIDQSHMLSGNVIKTNFYYMITNNEPEIYSTIGKLNEGLRTQFYENTKRWTKELIEILQPKIIICEGKQAFDQIVDIFHPIRIESNYDNCYLAINENYPFKIIGYSRRFSNIKNKQGLSKLISEVI